MKNYSLNIIPDDSNLSFSQVLEYRNKDNNDIITNNIKKKIQYHSLKVINETTNKTKEFNPIIYSTKSIENINHHLIHNHLNNNNNNNNELNTSNITNNVVDNHFIVSNENKLLYSNDFIHSYNDLEYNLNDNNNNIKSYNNTSNITTNNNINKDIYRFIQPRRLISWVQDDAVSICFKCHIEFTLLIRKHHCRACGRIFCHSCSTQRLVIPMDYESTPILQSNASQTFLMSSGIDKLTWIFTGISNTTTSTTTTTTNNNIKNDNRTKSYKFHSTKVLEDMSKNQIHSYKRNRLIEDIKRIQEKYPNMMNRVVLYGPAGSSAVVNGSRVTITPATSKIINKSNNNENEDRKKDKQNKNKTKIQNDIIHNPIQSITTTSQRVCDDCASALVQRIQHHDTVQVFELCDFNLKELGIIGTVCRKWHRSTIIYFSIFRQIQYYLPSHQLSYREKKMLTVNRYFLKGHTKWLLQLLKTIDWNNDIVANETIYLLKEKRKYPCMKMMCSRLCSEEFSTVDALEILQNKNILNIYNLNTIKIRDFFVNILINKTTEDEWIYYLPILLHCLSMEKKPITSSLGKAMIKQSINNIRFCNDFFWGLTIITEDLRCRRKMDSFKHRFMQILLETNIIMKKKNLLNYLNYNGKLLYEQLLRGQEFIDILWRLPYGKDIKINQIGSILKYELNVYDIFPKLLNLPLDPFIQISGIDCDTLEIKTSAETPIIIRCEGVINNINMHSITIPDDSMDNIKKIDSTIFPSYRIMYKRDDLRKDRIVQNIISVMYSILKKEFIMDVPLVTYRVLPTSSKDGLIEIVNNAHTLYSIIRDHGSILKFLHLHNGHRKLNEISCSFRESLAAYTVITFLLGVGDRHADNVMLTKDGILFHIDYGFILGKDPKPLQPPMRIDSYMIEALGGADTTEYKNFKQLCVNAFNCLRRHVNIFMIMLSLVVEGKPEIIDFGYGYIAADLEAFIVERFLPGQSDDEAASALCLRMEGKFNERIGLTLSDFIHAHASEGTVSKSMTTVGSSVRVGVETVGTTVQQVASTLTTGASSIYQYVWGK